MPRGMLRRMRAAITHGEYDLTAPALAEMAEDELDVWDLESAILTGQLLERRRNDPRGTRYVVDAWSADQATRVGVVCRFTETGRLLIITVYRIAPPEGYACMYGYPCEFCTGTVRAQRVEQEVFKHAHGFVILEQVTIGVCDVCGNRYYRADLLRQVEEIAAGRMAPERIESIPVSRAKVAP